MKTTSVMIVGVGGQGSLLASKLMGRLLIDEGYDVKVSEVHGMSQRGGSVVTYVRFGEKVYSPIITAGEADLIISFEKLEAARYAPFLKKGGRIVVNTQQIDPMPVIIGAATYPTNVLDELTAKGVRVEAIVPNKLQLVGTSCIHLSRNGNYIIGCFCYVIVFLLERENLLLLEFFVIDFWGF